MSAKHLLTDEMVAVSNGWTDKKAAAHGAILATPMLASLVPLVRVAHKGILAVAPQPTNPRVQAIMVEEGQVDGRHDALIRGTHGLLTALAQFVMDPATAKAFLELRDSLLPDGLASQQKTYRAEAGQGERLEARLTPALKKRLAGIPVLDSTLGAFVTELLAKAARLGKLEEEKTSLTGPAGESEGAATVAARNQWIRTTNAFVANGELAGLDEATDHAIFGAYRQALKKAEQRAAGAAPDAPADPAAPAPAP